MSVPEVDWPTLWDAFIPAGYSSWLELDPISQAMFKAAWHYRAVPIMATIVQAVADHDRDRKAARN